MNDFPVPTLKDVCGDAREYIHGKPEISVKRPGHGTALGVRATRRAGLKFINFEGLFGWKGSPHALKHKRKFLSIINPWMSHVTGEEN